MTSTFASIFIDSITAEASRNAVLTSAVVFMCVAVVFAAVEIFTNNFGALPFAISAVVASAAGFTLDWNPTAQGVVFVAVGAVGLAALRPLAKRVNAQGVSDGIGALRLIGARGVTLERIERGELGMVRIEREDWRGETRNGAAVEAGVNVVVVDVRGTRVVVEPDAT